MTTLGAILLNPPVTSGARTLQHLQAAARSLDCDSVEIANLFAVPTRDVTAINAVGQSSTGWDLAQDRLREIITASDHLIAAWGVSGLSGHTARQQRKQLEFVFCAARDVGQEHIWTLNGEPRHPSRWHQYVSDRHARASGASLTERLAMVLKSVPIKTVCMEMDSEAT